MFTENLGRSYRMLKKIFILFITLFSLSAFAADTSKKLTLKIEFFSKPNSSIYDHPIHFTKIININPDDDRNAIIMTQSKIEHNFPVTLIMLVKPVEMTKNQVDLRFNLLQYGFNQRGSVITQPRIILANGQAAEMKTDMFQLKVKAKWI